MVLTPQGLEEQIKRYVDKYNEQMNQPLVIERAERLAVTFLGAFGGQLSKTIAQLEEQATFDTGIADDSERHPRERQAHAERAARLREIAQELGVLREDHVVTEQNRHKVLARERREADPLTMAVLLRQVRDMAVDEVGYVVPWAVYALPLSNTVYLHTEAHISPTQSGSAQVGVRKRSSGYSIAFSPHCQCELVKTEMPYAHNVVPVAVEAWDVWGNEGNRDE